MKILDEKGYKKTILQTLTKMKLININLREHWNWPYSMVVSILGLFIGFLGLLITIQAYIYAQHASTYAKQANEDTNKLLIANADKAIIETIKIVPAKKVAEKKDSIRQRIVDAAVSEYRLKGKTNAKIYLLNKYDQLKNSNWTKSDFEDVYKHVGEKSTGGEFSKSLFSK